MSFGPSLRPKVKDAAATELSLAAAHSEEEDAEEAEADEEKNVDDEDGGDTAPSSDAAGRRRAPSGPFSSSAAPAGQRVVVLVDLDCFYAQCECVRLGYDAMDTPLVLMQWNSALAVTYPARRLGIERGDSWQAVHDKSKGSCLAVHVPVISAATAASASAPSSSSSAAAAAATNEEEARGAGGIVGGTEREEGGGVVDLDGAGMADYDAMFRLSPKEQEAARKRDVGKRRLADQGKACIERYRIASARILETVSAFLSAAARGAGSRGGGSIQVERASIDEFYMDVTDACASAVRRPLHEDSLPEDWEQAIRETNVIRPKQPEEPPARDTCGPHGEVEASHLALQYGCWLAWKLRQEVRNKLGFTLSAGVAANKMLAKLSASYGKPNGQAVLYPDQVTWLLDQTPIRKCRNLGGKLGGQVRKLLPPNVPETVGSIAKYVSYQMLTGGGSSGAAAALSPDSARWLLEYVRGVDMEAVQQETIVKTITSSKTLNKSPPLPECAAWFELLVKEVVTRVERDAQTHNRYPRFYHVHYLVYNPSTTKRVWQQSSRGWKSSFPRYTLSTANKVNDIMSKILPAIAAKEKNPNVRLQLIGLGALDFVDRPSGGVRNYFAAVKSNESSKATGEEGASSPAPESSVAVAESARPDCESEVMTSKAVEESDEHLARRLQTAYDSEGRALQPRRRDSSPVSLPTSGNVVVPGKATGKAANGQTEDPDLVLARRLQADYDRENRMVQALERREKMSVQRSSKTRKIDSFFKRTSN